MSGSCVHCQPAFVVIGGAGATLQSINEGKDPMPAAIELREDRKVVEEIGELF
jgi:hypothetical protein